MMKTRNQNTVQAEVLNVLVTGGGPVGLSFALSLEHQMGHRVAIKVYDGRWMHGDSGVIWKNEEYGNVRRQQVVTIQSRQFLKLPIYVQNRVFQVDKYTEMWPIGPDSINGLGPRNVRIAYLEDTLLEIANEKENIQLVPTNFDPIEQWDEIVRHHLLVICEGNRSRTRGYFIDKFGKPDKSMYSLNGKHLEDIVLGLKVVSDMPDSTAVLLTVAQNRFLLNSFRGNGILNMRLTDEEVEEVIGIDPHNREFKECKQSSPCIPETENRFGRSTLFLPSLLKTSPLWGRILEGLKLFQIEEENLSAITAFRLGMVQRPRFTVELSSSTETTPGTFGCLLGDAANTIHFWPGRGLNSGLASAISLVRCLKDNWRGKSFRSADFVRHEGNMAMLQYRHKSRAWQAMIATDNNGNICSIKEKIKIGILESQWGQADKASDLNLLMERLVQLRTRLEGRLTGLPNNKTLRNHLESLDAQTLHTLVISGAWDTATMGGEEVDIDLLFEENDAMLAPELELSTTKTKNASWLPKVLSQLSLQKVA